MRYLFAISGHMEVQASNIEEAKKIIEDQHSMMYLDKDTKVFLLAVGLKDTLIHTTED